MRLLERPLRYFLSFPLLSFGRIPLCFNPDSVLCYSMNVS